MFPVILPVNERIIKLLYKNVITVDISHVCRLDIYFRRQVIDGDKEVLTMHFLDHVHEWYNGTVIEYDTNKCSVELLYDILTYVQYIVKNRSNLICDYKKYLSLPDNEDLNIEVWFNMDRSELLRDTITVGEFKTIDKSIYRFTYPLTHLKHFSSPLTTIEEKEEVDG